MLKNVATRTVYHLFLVFFACFVVACSNPKETTQSGYLEEENPDKKNTPQVHKPVDTTLPPAWSKQAVWYQIFVERFYNGDPSNDPTKLSIAGAYPGFVPTNWTTTPWTHDWYTPDKYFEQLAGKVDFNGRALDSFDAKTALRRYGGDLQGVLEKLDYLASLGVNALYFNPINDAPSLHKYDARNWRHVDVNFGPDPIGDRAIIAKENPIDPDSWQLTSADKLFVEVIKQAHKRGMHVILDYSWNHTGHTFWAWQDVLDKQESSDYAQWYWVKQFDDPSTPDNEFEYRGWFDVFELPEIKETEYVDHAKHVELFEGDIYSEAAKNHILAVTKRWLDPNGDGDTSDGVDGFRLDVAAEIPLGFWRDYRRFVKTINPNAYLVGEIWWKEFPDDLFDPAPVLQGDVFDAVMNYRWYRTARHFFAEAPETLAPSEFVKQLKQLSHNINNEYQSAMMNMSASHDSPRLLTSFNNNNKYKLNAKESQNSRYKSSKPSQQAIAKAKLLLAHQFTYIGAPQIWAGDEMGMWGSDDPHNRKPLIWPEYSFEDESSHPKSRYKRVSKVAFDASLHNYYQSLISLRRDYSVLVDGEIEFIGINDRKRILSYLRSNPAVSTEKAFAIFNLSNSTQQITLPEVLLDASRWTIWRSEMAERKTSVPAETLLLEAQSSMVIIIGD